MSVPHRWTLTRYLIEERRRFPQASGELNALILDLALACKALSRIVACGSLAPEPEGLREPVDAAADARRPLDVAARDLFVRMTEWGGNLAGLAVEDGAPPRPVPAVHARGKYLLVVDALDGAVNLDVDVPVGSLFSILRAPSERVEQDADVEASHFLQPGAAQVAAGYAIYGPVTMLVLSVGNGVAGFTLDPVLGEFMLTHPQLQVPEDTHEFAVDTSNRRTWEPPVRRYVDECLAGRAGVRGKDFDARWIASLIAETHRILMRGGVFLSPRDPRESGRPGRVRLLHEAAPIAFLMEQAGGRASTGRQPMLGVRPTSLDQRIGLVFGARREVERVERYHRELVATDRATPLFAERGLFRA
jgi:fructose-1,6-bisphosphatase I/sedoheptulose-1,7-bisphosphatase